MAGCVQPPGRDGVIATYSLIPLLCKLSSFATLAKFWNYLGFSSSYIVSVLGTFPIDVKKYLQKSLQKVKRRVHLRLQFRKMDSP